jgi:hypothetical protein
MATLKNIVDVYKKWQAGAKFFQEPKKEIATLPEILNALEICISKEYRIPRSEVSVSGEKFGNLSLETELKKYTAILLRELSLSLIVITGNDEYRIASGL